MYIIILLHSCIILICNIIIFMIYINLCSKYDLFFKNFVKNVISLYTFDISDKYYKCITLFY